MRKQIQLATNLGRGGVSALILTGTPTDIKSVDNAVDKVERRGSGITKGELVYGVIKDKASGNILDEVIITSYNETCRIITGHGGSASALALLSFFTNLGFEEAEEETFTLGDADSDATYLKALLPKTKTEYQALSCIRAINNLKIGNKVSIEQITELMRPRVIVLAGAPNVGKSSLLNKLCGYERVLVSNVAGTTRDAVRDYIDIAGYYTHIIDTAGFRADAGESEREAIKRGGAILTTADIILLVLDSSRELDDNDKLAIEAVHSIQQAHVIPVLNKSDIAKVANFDIENPTAISCTEDTGIAELIRRIATTLKHPKKVGS